MSKPQKSKPQILPCPFCGCKPKVKMDSGMLNYINPPVPVVRCVAVKCGINPETSPCDIHGKVRGREGAIKAWNCRRKATGMILKK